MGRKKKDGAEGDAPAKKSNLVPAVVVAVGLLGGGYLMGGKGGSAPAGADVVADAAAETTTTTVAEGAVIALDPITLNLADGRFLKVALAIQLAETAEAGADEEPAAAMAKALDEAIDVFGGRTYADLAAPGGRAAAKEELSTRVKGRYEGDVLDVYFTEFVMQ